jgi:hypothetical protein
LLREKGELDTIELEVELEVETVPAKDAFNPLPNEAAAAVEVKKVVADAAARVATREREERNMFARSLKKCCQRSSSL